MLDESIANTKPENWQDVISLESKMIGMIARNDFDHLIVDPIPCLKDLVKKLDGKSFTTIIDLTGWLTPAMRELFPNTPVIDNFSLSRVRVVSSPKLEVTGYKISMSPEEIVSIINKNPHEITILAIGPLTNIAKAFTKDPSLPGLINEIIIMGGAINVCGNKNRVSEFNFYVDPEAADIVLTAECKKILIPLDACNQTAIFMNEFNKLKTTKLYAPIMSLMNHYISGIKKHEGLEGAIVYDALAAYYLLSPDSISLEAMDIIVETDGLHTRGQTVAEKRLSKEKK